MISGKKIVAIVPARGGSKRLPRKNVLKFNGMPLLYWSILAGLESKYVDRVLVTSDCSEIIAISKKYGADIIERPSDLASDDADTLGAIRHALLACPGFDYVAILQPTSPLRDASEVDEAIRLLDQKNADGIVSVCKVEHSPLWCNTLPHDCNMEGFIPVDKEGIRSQDLGDYFRLNGAIYLYDVNKLLDGDRAFYSKNVFAYKMGQEKSVDIDTEADFLYGEALLRQKNN